MIPLFQYIMFMAVLWSPDIQVPLHKDSCRQQNVFEGDHLYQQKFWKDSAEVHSL